MCVRVLPTCMHVHRLCVWSPERPEKGIRSPGNGVTDDCEPQVGAGNQTGSSRGAVCAAGHFSISPVQRRMTLDWKSLQSQWVQKVFFFSFKYIDFFPMLDFWGLLLSPWLGEVWKAGKIFKQIITFLSSTALLSWKLLNHLHGFSFYSLFSMCVTGNN